MGVKPTEVTEYTIFLDLQEAVGVYNTQNVSNTGADAKASFPD